MSTCMRLLGALRQGFSRLVVPIEGKIEIHKRKDSDLTELKRHLEIEKQNKLNNPQAIYDQIPHREVYRKMNTSLEAFFNKRSFDLTNFNFLVSVIAEQAKPEELQKVLSMMHSLKIEPDELTYSQIIRAWSQAGNLQKSEECFEMYKKKFTPTKFAYNSMMIVYKRLGVSEKAEQLFLQMQEQGIVPDLAIYTTLINCNHKSRNLERCWQLHKLVLRQKLPLDQPYIGMMMTVYASSHDTQKAIRLYEDHIKNSQQAPLIQTLNAYLKALSARSDYCERAINFFFMMITRGDYINSATIVHALKACANLGHIKDATSIVKIMRDKGIEPDVFVYNSLMRCYAGGVSLPRVSDEMVEMFITDAWKLMDEVSKKNIVNVNILNSFLLIFTQAIRTQQIQGLVLPLYQKYGVQMNEYTYETLMKYLVKKDDVPQIEKMWEAQVQYINKKKQRYSTENNQYRTNFKVKRGHFFPTFDSTCIHLDNGIKLMDMDKIIESLKLIKSMGRYPKFKQLKFLGQLKNVPAEIKAQLLQFETRYGHVRGPVKGKQWEQKRKEHLDPQDK